MGGNGHLTFLHPPPHGGDQMLEGIYWYDFSGAASLLTLLLATLRLLGVQVCGEGSVTKPLRLTKKFPLWCHPPPHIPKKSNAGTGTARWMLKKLFFFQIRNRRRKNFGCALKVCPLAIGMCTVMVFGPLTVSMSVIMRRKPAQKHFSYPTLRIKKFQVFQKNSLKLIIFGMLNGWGVMGI